MHKDSHVKIFLDSIEIPLRIGIYDHEKIEPQRVCIDVALYADPNAYLKTVSINSIIDYGEVYDAITSWADRPQVHLIEEYLKELADLCFQNSAVQACTVSIKKSDVFGPSQGAGVELHTNRNDWIK